MTVHIFIVNDPLRIYPDHFTTTRHKVDLYKLLQIRNNQWFHRVPTCASKPSFESGGNISIKNKLIEFFRVRLRRFVGTGY